MTRAQIMASSLGTARIRISEPVWRYIIQTKNAPGLGRDQVQCKLDRLVRENPGARDRILVTNDEDVVDVLRDWCARALADAAQLRRDGKQIAGATLARETNKVIAAIDRHDNHLIEAAHIFNDRKGRR